MRPDGAKIGAHGVIATCSAGAGSRARGRAGGGADCHPDARNHYPDAALILFPNFVLAWGLVHIIGEPIIAACKVLLPKGQAATLRWFNIHNGTRYPTFTSVIRVLQKVLNRLPGHMHLIESSGLAKTPG